MAKKGRPRLGKSRICAVCGNEFYKPPSHVSKWPVITCSRKCCAVLRCRERAERTCEQCGVTFLAKPQAVQKGFGRFCSNKCNGIHDRRLVPTQCAHCNTPFNAPFLYIEKGEPLYCSMPCWHQRKTEKGRLGIPERSQSFPPTKRARWIKDKCERCGSTDDLQLDHIIPRFAGGEAVEENAQTLCRRCNRNKFWKEDLHIYVFKSFGQ